MKKKFYKIMYILFGKYWFNSNFPVFGAISKKVRSYWFKKINKVNGKVNIERKANFGTNIVMGNNSGIGINSYVQNDVTIGSNVMIGPDVLIYTINHSYKKENVLIIKQGVNKKKVKIGDNVWIGTRVIILPGVTIGNNVVIGAGSVVTKDIPDNVLAVGNPCIVKKKIGSGTNEITNCNN